MDKKIKILITHYADYNLDYEQFFYANQSILKANGIIYPWADTPRHDFKWQCRLFHHFDNIKNNVQETIEELKKMSETGNTLLFAAPVGIFINNAEFIQSIRKNPALKSWADAEVNAVWLAEDYAEEIDKCVLYNMPEDRREKLYKAALVNMENRKAALNTILACADKVHIFQENGKGHIPVKKILDAFELDLPLEKCAPLRKTAQVSAETYFAAGRLAGMLRISPYEILKNIKPEKDILTCIEPKKLNEIQKAHLPYTLELARKYGAELNFQPFADQKNWQPFNMPDNDKIRQFFENWLSALKPENTDYYMRRLEYGYNMNGICENMPAYIKSLRKNQDMPEQKKPVVSVLTLACDHEKYIAECMESVLAQKTEFAVEHIIVDDCSSDATPEIIEQYARKYASIKPVLLFGGAKPGRNVRELFARCHTPYAALCDGDDYFTDPYKLQKQHDFLKANPAYALCFHPVKVAFEGSDESFIFPLKEMLPGGIKNTYSFDELVQGNFIQTNSVMYRWRFKDKLPDWFDGSLVPGDWYWHLLHADTGKIGFLPDIMSVYRKHSASLFKDSFKQPEKHALDHGISELNTYSVLNKTFKFRFFSIFSMLANGIYTNMLNAGIKANDTSKFDDALIKFPFFGQKFLEALHLDAA